MNMIPADEWNGIKVFIKKTVDYTVRRRGDEVYTAVDRYGRMIWEVGCWKRFHSCKNCLELLGYEYVGLKEVHQNYQHWADISPVK